MRWALIAVATSCLFCLMTGPASALAQNDGGNLMLFPPSNMPMTHTAPASKQPVRNPAQSGAAAGMIEPPPAARGSAVARSPAAAPAPSAEIAPPRQKRVVLRQRRYAHHWRRHTHRHYRYYAGAYAPSASYSPSPLNILALPFVAAQHLLGQ